MINDYFLTDEGINFPTKLGLFYFIKLHENTYDQWKKSNSNYCKPLSSEIKYAFNKIELHHLHKTLLNPENSKWYLERAFSKKYNLTRLEKIQIENINQENSQIKIILNNKGKNKIE